MKKKHNKQHKRLAIKKSNILNNDAQNSFCDFGFPELPVNVIPEKNNIAMDSDILAQNANFLGYFETNFIGYPKLAELSQLSEYRAVAETTSYEMTREWIEFSAIGNDERNEEYIKKLIQFFKEIKAQSIFRQAIETEFLFGRAQVYLKFKNHDAKKPLIIDARTIQKGSFESLVNIEPMWTTPAQINTDKPLEPDFYKPRKWYIFGDVVHDSRLFTIISRPVSDILKPAYNFGGVSMTQLMMPYVNRWLRTVNSVSDLIHSFSLSGVKTNMDDVLSGGCTDENLIARADLYNKYRDNRGLMLIDRDSEEFFQFNTPLSTLDALLSQAQEQMSAPSHTPLVKLLGITPSGLNASSDGEIKVYYDYIRTLQENLLREPLEKLLKIAQLHLFGEINENIVINFKPLEQLSDVEKSQIRNTDCTIDSFYIQNGVLDPAEVRAKLANNKDSGYSNIDVDALNDDESGLLDFLNDLDDEKETDEKADLA